MRNFRVIDIYVKNCCLRLVTNRTGSMVFHSDIDPDGAESHNNFSSWIHLSLRLRVVSLLLENPLGKSSRARVRRRSLVSRRVLRSHVTHARPLFPADFRAKKRDCSQSFSHAQTNGGKMILYATLYSLRNMTE